jgi:hypothetical protein
MVIENQPIAPASGGAEGIRSQVDRNDGAFGLPTRISYQQTHVVPNLGCAERSPFDEFLQYFRDRDPRHGSSPFLRSHSSPIRLEREQQTEFIE